MNKLSTRYSIDRGDGQEQIKIMPGGTTRQDVVVFISDDLDKETALVLLDRVARALLERGTQGDGR
jgi:2-C-methyl-D-erythritol 4-phosphate cytidylyltransferase